MTHLLTTHFKNTPTPTHNFTMASNDNNQKTTSNDVPLALGWRSTEAKTSIERHNGDEDQVASSNGRVWQSIDEDSQTWPKKKIYSEITRFSEERYVNFVRADPDDFMNPNSISDIRGELAAMRIKCERLHSDLKECQSQVSLRDARLVSIQEEAGRYREDQARQSARAQTLQQRLILCEDELSAVRRNLRAEEMTVHSLTHDRDLLRTRLDALEERLKSHLMAREQAEQRALQSDRQLSEMLVRLSAVIGLESSEETPDVEILVGKISEMSRSNSHLRAKMVAIGGALTSRESEIHANEHALAQILTELEAERKESRKWQNAKHETQRQNEELQQKVEKLESEINEAEDQIKKMHKNEIEEKKASQELLVLRETLATLLATIPEDKEIKESVRKLLAQEKKYREDASALRIELTTANREMNREKEAKSHMEETLSRSKIIESRLQSEIANERKFSEAISIEKDKFEAILKRLYQQLWRGERRAFPDVERLNDEIVNRVEEIVQEKNEIASNLAAAELRERSLNEDLIRKTRLDDSLERERVEAKNEVQNLQLEVSHLTRRLQDSTQLVQKKQTREEALQMEINQLHKKITILEKAANKRLWGTTSYPSRQGKPRPGSAMPLTTTGDHKMRSSVVRMLGLDVGTVPASDETILRRLNNLVEAQRSAVNKKTDGYRTSDDQFNDQLVGTGILRATHKR